MGLRLTVMYASVWLAAPRGGGKGSGIRIDYGAYIGIEGDAAWRGLELEVVVEVVAEGIEVIEIGVVEE